MIADLKPYPAMKDSGVEWLGEVPEHWEVRRLRTILDMRVSNVDKHTKEDETPVRLCNYVDVYKNDRNSSAAGNDYPPENVEIAKLALSGLRWYVIAYGVRDGENAEENHRRRDAWRSR